MSTMLLSIKPQYAEVILQGEKQFEFRKCKPKEDVTHIIIYATSPRKQVVGEAEIEDIVEGTPSEVWEKAKYAAGITSKFFFSYYEGKKTAFAYKLTNVHSFDTPKMLSEYGVSHAPQSFVYI